MDRQHQQTQPTTSVVEVDAYLPEWKVWYGITSGRYWAQATFPGGPSGVIEANDMLHLDELMELHELRARQAQAGT